MGQRAHNARYPRYSYKHWLGTPGRAWKRLWNREDRRVTRHRLRRDGEMALLTPANRIGNLWDWS